MAGYHRHVTVRSVLFSSTTLYTCSACWSVLKSSCLHAMTSWNEALGGTYQPLALPRNTCADRSSGQLALTEHYVPAWGGSMHVRACPILETNSFHTIVLVWHLPNLHAGACIRLCERLWCWQGREATRLAVLSHPVPKGFAHRTRPFLPLPTGSGHPLSPHRARPRGRSLVSTQGAGVDLWPPRGPVFLEHHDSRERPRRGAIWRSEVELGWPSYQPQWTFSVAEIVVDTWNILEQRQDSTDFRPPNTQERHPPWYTCKSSGACSRRSQFLVDRWLESHRSPRSLGFGFGWARWCSRFSALQES